MKRLVILLILLALVMEFYGLGFSLLGVSRERRFKDSDGGELSSRPVGGEFGWLQGAFQARETS